MFVLLVAVTIQVFRSQSSNVVDTSRDWKAKIRKFELFRCTYINTPETWLPNLATSRKQPSQPSVLSFEFLPRFGDKSIAPVPEEFRE